MYSQAGIVRKRFDNITAKAIIRLFHLTKVPLPSAKAELFWYTYFQDVFLSQCQAAFHQNSYTNIIFSRHIQNE